MTRLERGVRGYSGISRGVSGLVTRIHTAGKDSIHLGGPGCATWETHVADTHTHTWREKRGLFKVQNKSRSLPDLANILRIYTTYSMFELNST